MPPPVVTLSLCLNQSTTEQSLRNAALHLLPTFEESPNVDPSNSAKIIFAREYEDLDFTLISNKSNILVNSYIIRKALIRKSCLTRSLQYHAAKHPSSSSIYPQSWIVQLSHPDELDTWLVDDCFELVALFEANQAFLWKPTLTSGGDGIYKFQSRSELEAILEQVWENALDDEEEDSGYLHQDFLIQRYISPLLLDKIGKRKFHIRAYVVGVGRFRAYLYREMLCLFAPLPYDPSSPNPNNFLTNTCRFAAIHNKEEDREAQRLDLVRLFWDLYEEYPDLFSKVYKDIQLVLRQMFEATLGQPSWFQPLVNAYEIFGVDFLLDETGKVWLLEVNATPDVAQGGAKASALVDGLFKGVVEGIWKPFVHGSSTNDNKKVEEEGGEWKEEMLEEKFVKVF